MRCWWRSSTNPVSTAGGMNSTVASRPTAVSTGVARTGARKNPTLPPVAKMLIADASAYSLRDARDPHADAGQADPGSGHPAQPIPVHDEPTTRCGSAAPCGLASRRGSAPPPGPRSYPYADAPVPADVNPLDAAEPTVLVVGRLLREVIIALAEGHALGPGDRADLRRIALRRLTPAPARQHHLPAPADPRLRDVAAILAADPADGRTLAETVSQ